MQRRDVALGVVAILVATVCVLLGRWQLNRLAQRRARNGVLAARLALPPLPVRRDMTADSARQRRVVAQGVYDFSAELTRIADAKPEAVYVFLPGGMGVNFVKQFRQAGLASSTTFLSAFTVDESTLPAQQGGRSSVRHSARNAGAPTTAGTAAPLAATGVRRRPALVVRDSVVQLCAHRAGGDGCIDS